MDTNIITLKQQRHHDVLYLVIFVCRRVFMYSRSRTNIVFFVPTTILSIIDFKRKSETSSIAIGELFHVLTTIEFIKYVIVFICLPQVNQV